MIRLIAILLLIGADDRIDRLSEQHRDWIEKEVLYIMADKEREAFLNLESVEERNAFIKAFWQRRDPDPITPINEFAEEHYRRYEYANKYFSRQSAMPGWMTDRGKIYIILGEPDDREDFTSVPMLYPTEVWFYLQDRRKALPPLNFLFWQEHAVGPYRMFNHFLDDVEDLMPAQPLNPDEARMGAYVNLQEMSPSLAQAAFSLRADQGVMANIMQPDRSSLDFQSLLSDIYISPHRRVDIRYVDEADRSRGIVESDYLFNYIPNQGMAHILPGPGDHSFVHFTVEIAPQNMTLAHDPDKNTYYTSFEVRAEVTTQDESTVVHSFTKQPFIQLTESQFQDVSYRSFSYRDMFPLTEGTFNFRVVLKNQARTEYTIFESELVVPKLTDNKPWIGELMPLYGVTRLNDATIGKETSPYRTFQIENVRLDPNAKQTVAIGNYLMTHVPTDNIPADYKLRTQIRIRNEDGSYKVEPLKEATHQLELYEYPIVLRMELEGLQSGNYRLDAELQDSVGSSISLRSMDFNISPLAAIHRAWAVQESIDGENVGLVRTVLAEQAIRTGQFDKGRHLAKQALSINPNIIPARLLLSRFHLDENQFQEAIQLLEPARAQAPENAEILLALGDAHFQSGNFQRAAELFDKASTLRGADTNLLNALGVSHAQLGNTGRAQEFLKRSLELDPSQQEIQKILATLNPNK